MHPLLQLLQRNPTLRPLIGFSIEKLLAIRLILPNLSPHEMSQQLPAGIGPHLIHF